MEPAPEQITIAVTVYSRRDFVLDAIQSALDQTVPVKVIVVEDCGPDAGMREFILGRFGRRIDYFRNAHNRGLCDNWNACLDYCRTPWISILHDDDLLRPNFVQVMLDLTKQAPRRSLYFGRSAMLYDNGTVKPATPVSWKNYWRDLDLAELADENFLLFPGQLFPVAEARAVGGVRPKSSFTGDWDLWFRLALRGGAAQTAAEVSVSRSYYGSDRGTSRVERLGWQWPLANMQRKRNLAFLRREKNIQITFDRAKLLRETPIPSRMLLRCARGFSPRLLVYNSWLLAHSTPPNVSYALLQMFVRCFGPKALKLSSGIWNRLRPAGRKQPVQAAA